MDLKKALDTTQTPLPVVLNPGNRLSLAVLATGYVAFIYFLTNHLHWIPPHFLEMTWVDQKVPFIPETIWIYHSDIPMFFVAYLLCRDLVAANKYLYAFLALHTFSNIIFVLWPTTYARSLFPLDPSQTDAATYFLFSWFRHIESPANCFPSLHVSSVFLTALLYWGRSRLRTSFFLLWAFAVAVSTLTTKQHYVVDIFGGMFMALVIYWLFFQKLSYVSGEARETI